MNHDAGTGDGLTSRGDWDDYYRGRDLSHLDRAAGLPCWFEQYLPEKPGRIFELGCANSELLARSLRLGWQVGGIDFHREGIEYLVRHVTMQGGDATDLLAGDIFATDTAPLAGRYDVLISNGFLEHFGNASQIIATWQKILRPGGVVISRVPNMFSVNAALFRIFDEPYFRQHIPITPEQFERMHRDAGLVTVLPAAYRGRYDIHMLIPWEKISERMGGGNLFRLVKVSFSRLIGKPLGLLPERNMKRFNSMVLGIYRKA